MKHQKDIGDSPLMPVDVAFEKFMEAMRLAAKEGKDSDPQGTQWQILNAIPDMPLAMTLFNTANDVLAYTASVFNPQQTPNEVATEGIYRKALARIAVEAAILWHRSNNRRHTSSSHSEEQIDDNDTPIPG
jgi:hypothetical protein